VQIERHYRVLCAWHATCSHMTEVLFNDDFDLGTIYDIDAR
jgi:hypothetical protein